MDNCSKNDLEVFFCIGETLEMREKGKQNEVIENQLNNYGKNDKSQTNG